MGPALFAYLRMRSGADALKPDLRVRAGFNRLGFAVPRNEHAILVVAHAAARQVCVPLLVLDQLLWWGGRAEMTAARPAAASADRRGSDLEPTPA
jgi:hypothetical protein